METRALNIWSSFSAASAMSALVFSRSLTCSSMVFRACSLSPSLNWSSPIISISPLRLLSLAMSASTSDFTISACPLARDFSYSASVIGASRMKSCINLIC